MSSSTYSYTGGIVGNLNPWNMAGSDKVVVEGCVNMASVTFTGNTTRNDEFIVAVGRVIAFSSHDACDTQTKKLCELQ